MTAEELTENGEKQVEEKRQRLMAQTLARIHARLENKDELYKLHLKHHHMSGDNFRRRTRYLQTPKKIYKLYDEVVDSCSTCGKFHPAPPRSKVSGLRSESFGDLLFIDHTEFSLIHKLDDGGEEKQHFLVFLAIDGSSNLPMAQITTSKEATTWQAQFDKLCMVWSVVPKAVCGDTAFFGSSLDQFWHGRGVKKIPTGPNTPWPNRAESAVRLFTLQLKKIADTLYLEPDALPNRQLITAEQLVLRAQWARNTSVTYGGRTPIEIATGRRPPDVVNVENEDFG